MIIKGLFALLALVLLLGGGYGTYIVYKSVQNTDVDVAIDDDGGDVDAPRRILEDVPRVDSDNGGKWVNNSYEVAKTTDYQFPANVLDIDIEVKRAEDLRVDPTRVLVKDLDDYKFFCLSEILRQRQVDFSYFKNQQSLDLLLFVPNEASRNELLKDFDYYEISYEVGLLR